MTDIEKMSLKLRDRPKSSTGPQSPDDNEGCYKLVMESVRNVEECVNEHFVYRLETPVWESPVFLINS